MTRSLKIEPELCIVTPAISCASRGYVAICPSSSLLHSAKLTPNAPHHLPTEPGEARCSRAGACGELGPRRLHRHAYKGNCHQHLLRRHGQYNGLNLS